MTGRFIAVVGPSGVGKDSVMEGLAALEPRIALARRVISRPSDAGGEAFDGVSETEFEARVTDGQFALWWAAHGLSYGIPASVDDVLAEGRDVVANLSRGVLKGAQDRFDQVIVVLLTAPASVLAARLTARGREDSAEITRRLARATFDMPTSVQAIEIDNAGTLQDAIAATHAALYPSYEPLTPLSTPA
ncbi:MAG: phosphonate metabolism protein/1,5-bisphosphokinase (PRPP-forming) PhnN [Pseudomonadota bacterium]